MVPRPLAPAQAMRSRTCAHVFQPCQARVHLVKVTPKIFGVGFKILQHTGIRFTRCRRIEASDQGNSEHGYRFKKVVSRISLTHLSFAVAWR